MAMGVGRSGGRSIADIDVTPMIDVLLVIFMLAQPLLQKSIDVQLPVESEREVTATVAPIVLEIDAAGRYALNTEPVPADRLEARLREVYAGRPDRVLFVKADGEVVYQDVITAMDAARGTGVEVLGAMLEPSGPPGAGAASR